jgi:hypothetical protein
MTPVTRMVVALVQDRCHVGHAQSVAQQSEALDAAAVRDLIALRLMLDDGTGRANVAHQYTRGSAVVALDAAVERAAYLVAPRRGINVGPRDGLGELHSKLVQSIPSWKPTMWAQVRHLHEARNGAQHKGLTPAAEEVPGFAAAARAYVVSLVRAEYGAELDWLILADAVRNDQLAELLRTGECSLLTGDIRSSVIAAKQAFNVAVDWWSKLHGRVRHTPTAAFHSELGFIGDDRVGKAVGSLQRAMTEASFASSAAEYEWFRSACNEPLELLDAEDAERMLALRLPGSSLLSWRRSNGHPTADIEQTSQRGTFVHRLFARASPASCRCSTIPLSLR